MAPTQFSHVLILINLEYTGCVNSCVCDAWPARGITSSLVGYSHDRLLPRSSPQLRLAFVRWPAFLLWKYLACPSIGGPVRSHELCSPAGGLACPALPSQDQNLGRQPWRSSSAPPQGIPGRRAHALSLHHNEIQLSPRPVPPEPNQAGASPVTLGPEGWRVGTRSGSTAILRSLIRSQDLRGPPPPTPGACSHRYAHTAAATSICPRRASPLEALATAATKGSASSPSSLITCSSADARVQRSPARRNKRRRRCTCHSEPAAAGSSGFSQASLYHRYSRHPQRRRPEIALVAIASGPFAEQPRAAGRDADPAGLAQRHRASSTRAPLASPSPGRRVSRWLLLDLHTQRPPPPAA